MRVGRTRRSVGWLLGALLVLVLTAGQCNGPPTDSSPAISPIADQQMLQAESLDVAFTVTDEFVDSVSVVASSADSGLVPTSGLEVLGSGGNRMLRITPDPGRWGSTSVTLTAEDQEGSVGSQSFVLAVTELFATAAVKLTASDAADRDQFGSAVAVDGKYALIGAPFDDDSGTDSGSVYVFHQGASGWAFHSKLPPAAPVIATAALSAGDSFGDSVAISGVYAIVGAPGDSEHGTNAGAAYVYERCTPALQCSQAWFELGKLTAIDAADNDHFGRSVGIDGDYAIIGAYRDDLAGTSEGSAYVFERSGDAWTELGKLTASDAADNDNYGWSVAIDGDYAIIGVPFHNLTGFDEGSAYVFKRSGDTWGASGKLTASDAADFDFFGDSVAISGDYAIIGARFDDLTGTDEGSAYAFKRSGDVWSEIGKLTASDAADSDRFGWSVAIDGDYAIIGAYLDDLIGTNEGSAYIFKK